MYDVFHLSYDETTADLSFEHLQERAPLARRVEGIVGIKEAHARCAALSRTRHFFVVDCDTRITDPTVFKYRVPEWDAHYVHLWYSRNAVNRLVYGWGGVKLFPRAAFDDAPAAYLDLTTTFPLKIIPEVASTSVFNSSPFETWRSAFRECTKLVCLLDRDPEAPERLRAWCEGARGLYAAEALRGALAGRQYAESRRDDATALQMINDYDWLRIQFEGGTAP